MIEKFFENIERTVVAINKVFLLIACLMMVALMVIVCIDLTLRYFFNNPLIWGTEVTEIFLLYITFLGAAWVFREDAHVVIDVFIQKVSQRKKDILTGISHFLTAIICVVLIVYGFYATYDHYRRGVFNPTIIETPIALILMIIPIGGIPLFLEVLVKSWKLIRK